MAKGSELKETIGDLIKILSILRKTSPEHRLSEGEREAVIKSLDAAVSRLEKIREDMRT